MPATAGHPDAELAAVRDVNADAARSLAERVGARAFGEVEAMLADAELDARHAATGREIYLALDHGPCHTSKANTEALAERAEWLHVIWLAKCSPELNPKERDWRVLKRDARSHLAPSLRAFVDGTSRVRRAGPRGVGRPRGRQYHGVTLSRARGCCRAGARDTSR